MKFFALMVDGIAAEVIPESVTFGEGDEAREVPLSERYTEEFIASLVPYDPDKPGKPEPVEVTAEQVRAERGRLLASSDWTQLRDVPDSTATPWAKYRQALRDVPAQAGFPAKVKWPKEPA